MTLNIKPLLRPNTSDNEQTIKNKMQETKPKLNNSELLKYTNVFGSSMNPNQKTQKPKDYSTRLFLILQGLFKKENELEILIQGYKKQKRGVQASKQKIQKSFNHSNTTRNIKKENKNYDKTITLNSKNEKLDRKRKNMIDHDLIKTREEKIVKENKKNNNNKKNHIIKETEKTQKNLNFNPFPGLGTMGITSTQLSSPKINTNEKSQRNENCKKDFESKNEISKKKFELIIEEPKMKNESRKRKPEREQSLSQETTQPTETKKQITQTKKKKRFVKKNNNDQKENKKDAIFKIKNPKPFLFEKPNYTSEEKKALNSITFFDSDENEIASDDSDFLSTRTKSSKVWEHMNQYFEPFTEECYQFCQQTDIEKQGFNMIPALGKFTDLNSKSNSEKANSEQKNTKSMEIDNSLSTLNQKQSQNNPNQIVTEKTLQRLLGHLVELDDNKPQNRTLKNKLLIDNLHKIQDSLNYWSNPQDPRFPLALKKQKQLLQIKKGTDENNVNNLKIETNEMTNQTKSVEILDNQSDTINNDRDEVEERLNYLTSLLKNVSQRNNTYKRHLLTRVTEIDQYEKNWDIRLKKILKAEQQYKDILKQTKGNTKRSSHN
ncbi:hypothetical protein M0813_22689 [Anaeramoeba flamelloides]|uniref:Uncharacterized protein n=1 Tax=Anaeramoeba flamelloides TaxID=1746091 RepID=A0ABQ8YDC1_9EUKA|nr:hypothetical protein M0813_22689 [Anaeramoeba flamelloides]